MIRILSNPKGKVYSDLLDLAFETCDTFQLVLRKDMMYDVDLAMESYRHLL
jgi:hypothetical protein